MRRFEYLIERSWRDRHVERVPDAVREAEWRPAPLGRLGRVLWRDIDCYLEFVEIARSTTSSHGPETSPPHERVPIGEELDLRAT